jgi:glycosyltransferase involved in cell wall biosynthesis
MNTDRPRVTLGLPVYNGAKYLERVLESALGQTFTDFELIISDNASTDGTQEICQRFAQSDRRIFYRRNEANVGLAANHNLLVDLARGKYFKWLAHDDECLPTLLQCCVEVLDAAPSAVAMVYTAVEKIDEAGTPLGVTSDHVGSSSPYPWQRLLQFLHNASIFNFTYGLMRTDVLRRTRLHGLYPMADRVLFAELAMCGELLEIGEPLYRLRLHSGRSLQVHATAQSRRELFDPSSAGKRSLLSIQGRVYVELVRGAWKTPRRMHEKLACAGLAVILPPWMNFRNAGGRWKRSLLYGVR